MKRYMAILGFVFVGVLAGLLVRGIPIVVQVNAGGTPPHGSQNGDVNGDTRLDLADAIYLVGYFFQGGPEPVAFAHESPALEEGINRTNQLLEEIANPCRERSDRLQSNGDGTVTDICSGLMWPRTFSEEGEVNWESAIQFCEESEFAGYDDWRLPTAMELKTLIDRDFRGGIRPPMGGWQFARIEEGLRWTNDETSPNGDSAWAINFIETDPNTPPPFRVHGKGGLLKFLPVRTHR